MLLIWLAPENISGYAKEEKKKKKALASHECFTDASCNVFRKYVQAGKRSWRFGGLNVYRAHRKKIQPNTQGVKTGCD